MKTKLLLIMPSLYAGGAEKSFISMLPLLPRDKFDINVMIVHEGGLFYSRLPQDIKVIEAPKNLKIALGSIHGDFIKKKCNIWDKVCKIASNIIIRFRTLFNLDFSQLTWMLWKNSIPRLETHYDVAISYTNGITNYYVIDKINATKKILWVHTDFNKVKANHKFEYTYFSKADKVVTISLLAAGQGSTRPVQDPGQKLHTRSHSAPHPVPQALRTGWEKNTARPWAASPPWGNAAPQAHRPAGALLFLFI